MPAAKPYRSPTMGSNLLARVQDAIDERVIGKKGCTTEELARAVITLVLEEAASACAGLIRYPEERYFEEPYHKTFEIGRKTGIVDSLAAIRALIPEIEVPE